MCWTVQGVTTPALGLIAIALTTNEGYTFFLYVRIERLDSYKYFVKLN